MTGKERILAALSLRDADRTPVWVHAMNEASIINIGKRFSSDLPDPKPLNLMTPDELMKLLECLYRIHHELEIDGITSLPLGEETELRGDHYRDEWGSVWERGLYGMATLQTDLYLQYTCMLGFRQRSTGA